MTERKEGDKWGTSSKVKSARGTWTIIATASGMAKEAGDASTVDSYRTCSDGRSREDECSNGKTPTARGRVFLKELIRYGCG